MKVERCKDSLCVLHHFRMHFQIDEQGQNHKDFVHIRVVFFKDLIQNGIRFGNLVLRKISGCERAFYGKVVTVFGKHLLCVCDDGIDVVFYHKANEHDMICRRLGFRARINLVHKRDCLVEFTLPHKFVRLAYEHFVIILALGIDHSESAVRCVACSLAHILGQLQIVRIGNISQIILGNVGKIYVEKIQRQLIKNAISVVGARMFCKRFEESRI